MFNIGPRTTRPTGSSGRRAEAIEAGTIVVKPESGKGMVAMYLTTYGAEMISIRNSKGEDILHFRAVETGDGLVEVFVAGKKNTAGD